MDELFSFSTDRQHDVHHLRQICLASDEEEEDEITQAKKRPRSNPADVNELDMASGGLVCKRKRPRNQLKNKLGGRDLIGEDSEDDRDSDSSDLSSLNESGDEDVTLLSSASSSSCSLLLAPPQVLMDDDCRELLKEANRAITDFSTSPDRCLDSTFERSCHSPVEVLKDSGFTLRVRCQGKVHQCTTRKEDPLSLVARQLANTLHVDPDRILLQWKTTDLDLVATPAKLGISAVDILDAYVMDHSTAPPDMAGMNTIADEDAMTIKIQTTKKCSKYKVKEGETLERIMLLFASELGLRLEQLRFTFDGETIRRHHTAEDLDMADDDIIDATPV